MNGCTVYFYLIIGLIFVILLLLWDAYTNLESLKKAWKKEMKNHAGDYGDSGEYDLWCAFKSGWMAHSYQMRKHKKS